MLTWIEISRSALLHNLATISTLTGKQTIIAPCIKANAYGHGILEVAQSLQSQDNLWFTVSCVQEAAFLRQNKIQTPILVLNSLCKEDLELSLNLTEVRLSLYNSEIAKLADELTRKYQKKLKVHLQLDSGMHWLGILPQQFVEFVEFVSSCPFLEIEGIWTHFASSEDLENPYFEQQLGIFRQIKQEVEAKNFGIKFWHCSNSGAILRQFPGFEEFNMVQPGKIIYGSYATGKMRQICNQKGIFLEPVLTWKTQIVQIKNLKKGDKIGYEGTFVCPKDLTIAVLPVGYGDGLCRKLSNSGEVLIHGQKCAIVGRVCMNMCMVGLPEEIEQKVQIGEEVVIIGEQGDQKLVIGQIAATAGTIGREITTGIPQNIPRIIVD